MMYEEHHKKYKNVPRICRHCQSSFLTFRSAVNSGQGLYCSHTCYTKHKQKHPEIRFWRHVKKTKKCWLWTASRQGPYGAFNQFGPDAKRRITSAHRFSYQLHFGSIPQGMLVCHHCDNPLCVRPDHLFLGTHKDNSRDAQQKGRLSHGTAHSFATQLNRRRGEQTPNAILSSSEVYEIRAIGTCLPRKEIAARFGVSYATIGQILRGESWQHLL